MGRERYFGELGAVEIADTRSRLPRLETARRWREEAPAGFEFSLVAPAALTHQPDRAPRAAEATGHFRDTPATRKAWAAFTAVMDAVRPRFVVFETPASFYPHAGMIKDMYGFFRGARRGDASFVWAAHGGDWEARVQDRICADLKLVLAADPLNGRPPARGARYLRVPGRVVDGRLARGVEFSDSELRRVLDACGGGPAWVFLGNAAMWRDARRLKTLAGPGAFACAAS